MIWFSYWNYLREKKKISKTLEIFLLNFVLKVMKKTQNGKKNSF